MEKREVNLEEIYNHISEKNISRKVPISSYFTGSTYGFVTVKRIWKLYAEIIIERILNDEVHYLPRNFGLMCIQRGPMTVATKFKRKRFLKGHEHDMNDTVFNPKTPGEYFSIRLWVTHNKARRKGLQFKACEPLRKKLSQGLFKRDLAYIIKGHDPEQIAPIR